MDIDPKFTFDRQEINDEKTIRLVRWFIIALVLLTFPPDNARATLVYIVMALFGLYNLSHYFPRLLQNRLLASKVGTLVIDNLFVGGFIYLIGGLSTEYAIFFVFTIISAVYLFGFRGGFMVVALQATLFGLITIFLGYRPLALDVVRNEILGIAGFLIVGFLIERLTRGERQERETLHKFSDQVQSEQQRLLVLINSLTDAIFVIDNAGQIIFYNGAALSLLNTNQNLQNKDLPHLLHLKSKYNRPVNLLEIAQTGPKLQSRDDLVFTLGENKIALDISIAPVRLNKQYQKRADYIIVCRDITKAKTLDEQRDEFISVASHELRTPLAITEGALSTAMMPSLGPVKPELLNLIKQAHHNVLFLGDLVRDLATLSHAQNDSIPLKLESVNPTTLLQDLKKDYHTAAKQKGLTLKVMVVDKIAPILSSEHYLREILQNYLTNALKYTNKGSITLQARQNKSGNIIFGVIDTGIGISPSDQKQLFTKFYRSEDYRTRQTGGTGLGLYLCTVLAQRLNGKVWCESRLNHGSKFFLEVPPVTQLKRDRQQVLQAGTSMLMEEL